ncbi:hypothetical protein BH11PSE11_BH11PSE11_22260 [soil metagenome]
MQRTSTILIALALAVLGLILLYGNRTMLQGESSRQPPREKLVLSVAQYSLSTPVYFAQAKGYFAAEGVDVTLREAAAGKFALEDLVTGKADLATAAEIPVVRAVARGEALSIVATVGNTDADYSILARRESGIENFADLKGKKIGVSSGTTAQYYFYRLLITLGVQEKDLEVIDVAPADIVAALTVAKVDAIVTWHPYMAEAQQILGSRGVHLIKDDLVRTNWMVIGGPEFVRQHPAAVRGVLRALIRAEREMLSEPDEARRIIAREIGMDPLLLASVWPNYHFEVALDQSLLVTLEEESRWAMEKNHVQAGKVPNFLRSIDYSFLQEIRPESVQLVR